MSADAKQKFVAFWVLCITLSIVVPLLMYVFSNGPTGAVEEVEVQYFSKTQLRKYIPRDFKANESFYGQIIKDGNFTNVHMENISLVESVRPDMPWVFRKIISIFSDTEIDGVQSVRFGFVHGDSEVNVYCTVIEGTAFWVFAEKGVLPWAQFLGVDRIDVKQITEESRQQQWEQWKKAANEAAEKVDKLIAPVGEPEKAQVPKSSSENVVSVKQKKITHWVTTFSEDICALGESEYNILVYHSTSPAGLLGLISFSDKGYLFASSIKKNLAKCRVFSQIVQFDKVAQRIYVDKCGKAKIKINQGDIITMSNGCNEYCDSGGSLAGRYKLSASIKASAVNGGGLEVVEYKDI